MNVIQRNTLTFPRVEDLPVSVLRRVNRLHEAFAKFESTAIRCTPTQIENTLRNESWNQHRNELCHPLSNRWLATRVPEVGATRCANKELRDIRAHAHTFRRLFEANATLAKSAVLHEPLCHAASAIVGNTVQLRTHPVALAPDTSGTAVSFCEWNTVPTRLQQLYTEYSRSALPSIMKALIAYLCFINIHPFADGNGRTSRVLFNALLHADERQCYIPIKCAADASDGGYELRLREAELNANWVPIMQYIETIINIQQSNLEALLGIHA